MARPSNRAVLTFFKSRFAAQTDLDRAAQQRAYMKSDLAFHGVPQPALRAVCNEFRAAHRDVPLDELWPALEAMMASKSFDLRMAAICLLEKCRNQLTPAQLEPLSAWVAHAACWAHVDPIASLIGHILAKHPREKKRLLSWARHKSFWLRRVAVIAQNAEFRRGGGDFALWSKLALPLLGEQEFFIRKALGWALRDVSKQRPELVRAFLDEHRGEASSLTVREASRYL